MVSAWRWHCRGYLIARRSQAGEITPEEAAIVAGVLEVKRKALETAELEKRIAALEQREGDAS
jgi:ubiquinone biosynthesis protein UbiJ